MTTYQLLSLSVLNYLKLEVCRHTLLVQMVGRNWTSPDQSAFLNARMDVFLKAQTQHTLHEFFPSVCNDFFERWPERDHLYPNASDGVPRVLTSDELALLSAHIVKRKKVSHWRSWPSYLDTH